MARGQTIRGPKAMQRFMRDLPGEVEDAVEDQAPRSAEAIAREARTRATSAPGVARVARYLEPTIRANGTLVTMGGDSLLPAREGRLRAGRSQTLNAVLWGAEMGSSRYRQFSPWRDEGYIVTPLINGANADEIADDHADAAVDRIRSM